MPVVGEPRAVHAELVEPLDRAVETVKAVGASVIQIEMCGLVTVVEIGLNDMTVTVGEVGGRAR